MPRTQTSFEIPASSGFGRNHRWSRWPKACWV